MLFLEYDFEFLIPWLKYINIHSIFLNAFYGFDKQHHHSFFAVPSLWWPYWTSVSPTSFCSLCSSAHPFSVYGADQSLTCCKDFALIISCSLLAFLVIMLVLHISGQAFCPQGDSLDSGVTDVLGWCKSNCGNYF